MTITLYMKLAIAAAIIAALWGLHHYIDKGGYDRAKNEDETMRKEAVIKQQEENQRITLAYAKKLTEAMENEQHYQTVIADAVNRAERVRVHFDPRAMSGATGTASDRDEASRILSERMDALFGVLQARATDLFTECEEVNKQAIRNNSLHE